MARCANLRSQGGSRRAGDSRCTARRPFGPVARGGAGCLETLAWGERRLAVDTGGPGRTKWRSTARKSAYDGRDRNPSRHRNPTRFRRRSRQALVGELDQVSTCSIAAEARLLKKAFSRRTKQWQIGPIESPVPFRKAHLPPIYHPNPRGRRRNSGRPGLVQDTA